MLGLHRVERGDPPRSATGWRRPRAGTGYLTEAARAVIDFAFDPQGST
jgi:RimJ/RimL family protein N-acetyltransferase